MGQGGMWLWGDLGVKKKGLVEETNCWMLEEVKLFSAEEWTLKEIAKSELEKILLMGEGKICWRQVRAVCLMEVDLNTIFLMVCIISVGSVISLKLGC